MSTHKKFLDFQERYENFKSPYTGIATMVLVQAASDLSCLDGREQIRKDGEEIRKWEIVNFFRSGWARFLAENVGIDADDLLRFEREFT